MNEDLLVTNNFFNNSQPNRINTNRQRSYKTHSFIVSNRKKIQLASETETETKIEIVDKKK